MYKNRFVVNRRHDFLHTQTHTKYTQFDVLLPCLSLYQTLVYAVRCITCSFSFLFLLLLCIIIFRVNFCHLWLYNVHGVYATATGECLYMIIFYAGTMRCNIVARDVYTNGNGYCVKTKRIENHFGNGKKIKLLDIFSPSFKSTIKCIYNKSIFFLLFWDLQ